MAGTLEALTRKDPVGAGPFAAQHVRIGAAAPLKDRQQTPVWRTHLSRFHI